jgi:hypothetical protein
MEMKEIESLVDYTKLPKTLKLFLSLFIICMGLGYLSAIGNIATLEGLSIQDISDHYHGNEAKMIEPPTVQTLFEISHVHLLGMATMIFCTGLVFIFTKSAPHWLKEFALVDGFTAVLIAVASFWLIRFVAGWMAIFMALSGMLLGLGMLIMLTVPLYEMWLKKEKVEVTPQ